MGPITHWIGVFICGTASMHPLSSSAGTSLIVITKMTLSNFIPLPLRIIISMNPLYDYSITIRDVRIDTLPDEWSLRLHCDKTDYVIPTTTKDYKSV